VPLQERDGSTKGTEGNQKSTKTTTKGMSKIYKRSCAKKDSKRQQGRGRGGWPEGRDQRGQTSNQPEERRENPRQPKKKRIASKERILLKYATGKQRKKMGGSHREKPRSPKKGERHKIA